MSQDYRVRRNFKSSCFFSIPGLFVLFLSRCANKAGQCNAKTYRTYLAAILKALTRCQTPESFGLSNTIREQCCSNSCSFAKLHVLNSFLIAKKKKKTFYPKKNWGWYFNSSLLTLTIGRIWIVSRQQSNEVSISSTLTMSFVFIWSRFQNHDHFKSNLMVIGTLWEHCAALQLPELKCPSR